MSLRLRFATLMQEVAEQDELLVVLVGDISHGILRPYADMFPSRYYNVGICEPSIVNVAAGLSHVGLRPVVHTIAPFLVERSFEQLKLDFGYQERSVNLVSVGGAFDYSQLGCSHHSYADAALIGQIPGSRVFLPSSIHELNRLFWEAYQRPGINYFRLTEHPHEQELSGWTGRVGDGVKMREGDDATIAVVGARLTEALHAASELSAVGLSAEVLYFPTLKPFDEELLRTSVTKTKCLVVVEELSERDGLYSRCIESCVGLGGLRARSLSVSEFIHDYGTYEELCVVAELDARSIFGAVKEMVYAGR